MYQIYKLEDEDKRRLIRIALHPRDPHHALEDQKQMILQLIDQGYEMLRYRDLIPRLYMLINIFLLFMANCPSIVDKRHLQ